MKDKRNTMQKELTYKAVNEFIGHPSADDIYNCISRTHSTISKATIYRNLSSLAEDGKIVKIESYGNGQTRYDKNLYPHYHAICMKCGKVVDVAVDDNKDILSNAKAMEDGFSLISENIVFKGICSKCSSKEREDGIEGFKDREEPADSFCR